MTQAAKTARTTPSRTRWARPTVLLIALVALAAGATWWFWPGPHVVGSWRLSSFSEGRTSVRLSEGLVTMEISRGALGYTAGGTDGCNTYSLPLSMHGSHADFNVRGYSGSQVKCVARDGTSPDEVYERALGEVDHVELDGDTLVLSGHGVAMRFRPFHGCVTCENGRERG